MIVNDMSEVNIDFANVDHGKGAAHLSQVEEKLVDLSNGTVQLSYATSFHFFFAGSLSPCSSLLLPVCKLCLSFCLCDLFDLFHLPSSVFQALFIHNVARN